MADIIPVVRANIDRETAVMTDEATRYQKLGDNFASHDAVNHSEDEYVRREANFVVHTNTVEGYYSIFKRGMKGIYCGIRRIADRDSDASRTAFR